MIKAILLDLGNVVVPFDLKPAFARMAELSGCPREEVSRRIRATGLVAPFERGEIEAETFARELSAALDLKISYAEFCDWWSCVFLEHTLVPEAMLRDLRSRYRLLALSNTNPIHFAALRAGYPLLRHFDDCVLSYEVGAAKPDAKIYREAIARARCKPEECFFTDDLAVNVEAARAQGMDAVQFFSPEQLERELWARGALSPKTG
ncbi:MAG TPA: HAD family phosphatase [Bryobacteraceae bacterium]|nr:HAD family phosphatase [Bryobacteraceae bacterium]